MLAQGKGSQGEERFSREEGGLQDLGHMTHRSEEMAAPHRDTEVEAGFTRMEWHPDLT